MPSRSGSAMPCGDAVVDAGHDVAVVDRRRRRRSRPARTRARARCCRAGWAAGTRSPADGQQHRVRLGVGEVRAPVPRRSAVHAHDHRQRARRRRAASSASPRSRRRPRAVHRIVRTSGNTRPSTMCVVERRSAATTSPVAVIEPGELRAAVRAPGAWSTRPRRPRSTTHAGVVTSSPMNASSRQRSSRRPSSQTRPQALPGRRRCARTRASRRRTTTASPTV